MTKLEALIKDIKSTDRKAYEQIGDAYSDLQKLAKACEVLLYAVVTIGDPRIEENDLVLLEMGSIHSTKAANYIRRCHKTLAEIEKILE